MKVLDFIRARVGRGHDCAEIKHFFGWKFAAMFLLAASYGVTVYADLDDGVRAPLAAVVAAAAVIAANERSEHSKVTELGLQSM